MLRYPGFELSPGLVKARKWNCFFSCANFELHNLLLPIKLPKIK